MNPRRFINAHKAIFDLSIHCILQYQQSWAHYMSYTHRMVFFLRQTLIGQRVKLLHDVTRVLRSHQVQDTRLSANFSSSPNNEDIELSYTTYPDQEHTVNSRKTPLIFTHGLFGAKGNLHSISKHLANDGRKVITYDSRNHGDSQHSPDFTFKSMSEDLNDLMEDLGLVQPIVMGHSMGGKTAMMFALTKPDKLKALIVADVSPNKSPGVRTLLTYAEAMRNVKISSGASLSLARREAKLQLAPTVPDEGVLNFLLTNLKEFEDGQIRWRNNLDAFINNYTVIEEFPVPEGCIFTKPTLFVYGERSDHYKSADTARIKELFPNSEIVAIKDAGHFLHAQKPLEFVEIVQNFCEGVDNS